MIISFNYVVFIVDIYLDGSRLQVLGECRVPSVASCNLTNLTVKTYRLLEEHG